jgi:hypothetical protein
LDMVCLVALVFSFFLRELFIASVLVIITIAGGSF